MNRYEFIYGQVLYRIWSDMNAYEQICSDIHIYQLIYSQVLSRIWSDKIRYDT